MTEDSTFQYPILSQVSRIHLLYSTESADHQRKNVELLNGYTLPCEHEKSSNIRLRRQHKYITQEARLHYRHKEVKPLPNRNDYNILNK